MQDRFKVRVWNTLVKKFSYFDKPEMQIGTDGFDSGLIFPLLENSNLYMGKCLEPQFCTGLKDKNGKLIYEGDIVKYFCPAEYCSDGLHKCPECYSGENGSVHYDEDLAMYEYRSKSDQCPLTDNINTEEDLEIIGNIYENPELLEEASNGEN